ncbi:NAD(P)-dependent oxidoreductase [Evansella sp. AB-P1]|uniref:NAD-dependent epimerase/dehydratase family protein n=1 Tax=Evansella sp. AB-P1 TaxID=3037653 RepID=UPI00241F4D8C|nr:NAD(P)-dependent oxidoreductase [Evansella sp. AB-P1]MDG5787869.1 NAD(P)-dependent oxidoreductase [Evansella sp. AB-P1]
MKKVVIIGGAGTVGKILANDLSSVYRIVIIDQTPLEIDGVEFIHGDATNYHELMSKIPRDTNTIINLLKIDTNGPIEEINHFDSMTNVYFKATYYILMIAATFEIPKVIFASSNHVTDYYEKNGDSLLGREINVNDYPKMRSVYGLLKLASEQAGFIFSINHNISVINIRIGSVPSKNEKIAIQQDPRLKKTIFTDDDVAQLFRNAIEAKVKFGTYYGVSNNCGKPWDMTSAEEELGFKSLINSDDLL